MTFDANTFKASTKDQWNAVAGRWNAWGPLLDTWLGPATETLLDMCEVTSGSAVLHVAGGSGQDAMQSARRVGPMGRVLSTDFSDELTRIAAQNFEASGLKNLSAVTMDGEAIEVSGDPFDVVLSRVGLIFFPDQLGSVRSQMAALKPGGRVGALVYATPEECRFFSDPVGVIRKHAGLPPPAPGTPGPFSLGRPGAIESLFNAAGLQDIQTRKIDAPVVLESASDCLRFEKESFGALHQMLSNLGEYARTAAWKDVEAALERFETEKGFIGPCVMIAASARKGD
ncbi:class I SAM-dependent methyltransferase [Pseudooceanicola sp. C21-150M6]|uniref:class I SAM-dependent methyltransferase n=1 Tax=Pseudooceanicola sp. C21-150M6 TaxID=3434355 RepID=UPI003D7FAD2A